VRRALDSVTDPQVAFSLGSGLGEGLRRSGNTFEKAGVNLESLLSRANEVAIDSTQSEGARLEAVAFLAFGQAKESEKSLLHLFEPQQPHTVQLAVVNALDRLSPSDLPSALLGRWSSLTPTVRKRAVEILLKRNDRTRELVGAMEKGTVPIRDLSLIQRVALRQHSDANIQQRAVQLIGARSNDTRDEVVRRFRPASDLRGVAGRGKDLFQQRCQSCHRLGGDGFAVGPDLVGLRNDGREKLLINILDPNREVAPNYFAYLIETKEGDSYTGIIVSESTSGITIRQALGSEVSIPRSRIEEVQAQGKSLMPEGLEEGLTHQDLADLIEFIVSNSR